MQNNVLIQLNRVSHDVAVRVAEALDMTPPEADETYYHDNTTIGVSPSNSGAPLLRIDGFKVGLLTSKSSSGEAAKALKAALEDHNVALVTVAEHLGAGDQTYSATSAVAFDAIIVDGSAEELFAPVGSLANSNTTMSGNQTTKARSTLYPAGRPLQILQDGYQWGKPVGVLGSGSTAFGAAGIEAGTPGVYAFGNSTDMSAVVEKLVEGLRTFKFLDRYPLDN
jgi:catalase